jgi:hypothetical protein
MKKLTIILAISAPFFTGCAQTYSALFLSKKQAIYRVQSKYDEFDKCSYESQYFNFVGDESITSDASVDLGLVVARCDSSRTLYLSARYDGSLQLLVKSERGQIRFLVDGVVFEPIDYDANPSLDTYSTFDGARVKEGLFLVVEPRLVDKIIRGESVKVRISGKRVNFTGVLTKENQQHLARFMREVWSDYTIK